MAFKYADPEGLSKALASANSRLEREAPSVSTSYGAAQRATNPEVDEQGPSGEFAAAANDPEAAGYFNDYMQRLRFQQQELGDIPPPEPADAGMRPEEEEVLA